MARPARLWLPSSHPDPADWLAQAERLEAMAARYERDPHGAGTSDPDFVRQLRASAKFALRRAEELLAEKPTRGRRR